MLKSQELQIKMSQTRQRLHENLLAEEPNLEERSADIAELAKLESDYQAAVAIEGADTVIHNAGGETALSPLLELRSRVNVSDYVTAALESRALAGPAAEYNQEMGFATAGAELPLELLADALPDPHQEERVDAVTTPGVVNRMPAGRFLDRVMAGTHASFLGITYDEAAVGTPIHTIMTGGTTAAMVAAGEQHDAVAATFAIATLTPKRISARYVWRVEDVAKLAGLESALRRDISRVMAEHMDYTILEGDTSATGNEADIAGLKGEADVSVVDIDFYTATHTLEVAKVLAGFGGLIDGYYARQMEDIRVLMAAGITRKAASTIYGGNTASIETQMGVIRRAGLNWRTHEKLGGALGANDKYADNAIVAYGSRPLHREGVAVATMWPSVSLIRDPYTGAGQGQVQLTAVGLWDFKVIRANSFFRVTTDNS